VGFLNISLCVTFAIGAGAVITLGLEAGREVLPTQLRGDSHAEATVTPLRSLNSFLLRNNHSFFFALSESGGLLFVIFIRLSSFISRLFLTPLTLTQLHIFRLPHSHSTHLLPTHSPLSSPPKHVRCTWPKPPHRLVCRHQRPINHHPLI